MPPWYVPLLVTRAAKAGIVKPPVTVLASGFDWYRNVEVSQKGTNHHRDRHGMSPPQKKHHFWRNFSKNRDEMPMHCRNWSPSPKCWCQKHLAGSQSSQLLGVSKLVESKGCPLICFHAISHIQSSMYNVSVSWEMLQYQHSRISHVHCLVQACLYLNTWWWNIYIVPVQLIINLFVMIHLARMFLVIYLPGQIFSKNRNTKSLWPQKTHPPPEN